MERPISNKLIMELDSLSSTVNTTHTTGKLVLSVKCTTDVLKASALLSHPFFNNPRYITYMDDHDASQDISIPPSRVWEHLTPEQATNVLQQLVRAANEIYLGQLESPARDSDSGERYGDKELSTT